MYFAKSTVAEFSNFQHLIWLLKIEGVLTCLIIFGKVDQSLFPRKDIVSIPYVVPYVVCVTHAGGTSVAPMACANVRNRRQYGDNKCSILNAGVNLGCNDQKSVRQYLHFITPVRQRVKIKLHPSCHTDRKANSTP